MEGQLKRMEQITISKGGDWQAAGLHSAAGDQSVSFYINPLYVKDA